MCIAHKLDFQTEKFYYVKTNAKVILEFPCLIKPKIMFGLTFHKFKKFLINYYCSLFKIYVRNYCSSIEIVILTLLYLFNFFFFFSKGGFIAIFVC